ncbi:MAG: polysaccharide biosynthesis tyrosine autokinase [Actinobacteria bacterium]|nr:polysaccharide biosynthesis tyrosine autokinase [Actinomycetota bacterium]
MDERGRELDLRDYFSVVRRRWPVVAICTAALVAGVFALSVAQTDQYEGEARVLVHARASEGVFDVETGPQLDPELALRTEIEIIESEPVRRAVQEELGPVDEVVAERVSETLVIEVKARSSDPRRAARITNAYANAYIDLRREQAVDDLLGAGAVIQEKIIETQEEIAELEARLAAAGPAQQPTLQAQLDALVSQVALFEQRLDEVQVQAALKTGGVQLAAEATVPTEPVSPRPLRNSLLAVLLGLVLGLTLIALMEYLDESVKSRADLEEAASRIAVLAAVPRVRDWTAGSFNALAVAGPAPDGPVAEAYRRLRTSVELLGADRPQRVLQITSPDSGDGKTTTVCGLAVAMASLGRRVVIVDGDMRRPRLHEIFGVPNDFGLSSVLAGGDPTRRVVLTVRGIDRLWVVPSGPVPANPSELLADRPMAAFLHELKGLYDVVIVDSPPVLPVTDATLLAAWVDATVLVATQHKTSVSQVKAAVDRLRQVEAPLVGTVLNGADRYAEGHDYTYGYSTDSADGQAGRTRAGAGRRPAPTTAPPATSAPESPPSEAPARPAAPAAPPEPAPASPQAEPRS